MSDVRKSKKNHSGSFGVDANKVTDDASFIDLEQIVWIL